MNVDVITLRKYMDWFGEHSPQTMPRRFFGKVVSRDYRTAIRADVSSQNYTVCPRYWYVDAVIKCDACNANFNFTANEQKHWYEDLGFYVDSYAKNCVDCRKLHRSRKSLRQKYDAQIKSVLASTDLHAKIEMASLIDALCDTDASLPTQMNEYRRQLAGQIAKLENA